MKALLVKMSSLGDLVHVLPAMTDAHGHGVRFDWVVEEAYQAIAARHQAVDQVLPIAWRRWRKSLWRHRGEMRRFFTTLAASEYDLVLDAQGLLKSALVASRGRGAQTLGFSRRHLREPVAACFYERGIDVPRQQHAIDRQRQLFAAAFGYAYDPSEVSDFGLPGAEAPTDVCVLLHGSAWPSKLWPEPLWTELARRAMAAGLEALLPWGDDTERHRAQRIANASGGRVLDSLGLGELMSLLGQAKLVVGVDSGLTHLAAALGTRTLALYGSTSTALTGCRGAQARNLASTFGCSPCLSKTCRYRGPGRFWHSQSIAPPCYAELSPASIWKRGLELMDAASVLHI